ERRRPTELARDLVENRIAGEGLRRNEQIGRGIIAVPTLGRTGKHLYLQASAAGVYGRARKNKSEARNAGEREYRNENADSQIRRLHEGKHAPIGHAVSTPGSGLQRRPKFRISDRKRSAKLPPDALRLDHDLRRLDDAGIEGMKRLAVNAG